MSAKKLLDSMTSDSKTYRREQTRHYSAHHTFLRIAKAHLARARRKDDGWRDSALIVLIFSALAIEALSNAIGKIVVSDWIKFERLNFNEKVKQLTKQLGKV
ncbi:MAG TPA: hypothetical protein PKC23_07065 [Candidatus Desulfobacillus sp.]|nr:hypothetical protein [Candidatus Desulfobacillus sp.]